MVDEQSPGENGNTPGPTPSNDDGVSPFAGSHHARYLPADVPFHVISRVFQGRHLLRPGKTLNSLILGVLGRAQQTFPSVKLYAMAFMTNHFLCAAAHNMCYGELTVMRSGPPKSEEVADLSGGDCA